jgi:hypothetical protein
MKYGYGGMVVIVADSMDWALRSEGTFWLIYSQCHYKHNIP